MTVGVMSMHVSQSYDLERPGTTILYIAITPTVMQGFHIFLHNQRTRYSGTGPPVGHNCERRCLVGGAVRPGTGKMAECVEGIEAHPRFHTRRGRCGDDWRHLQVVSRLSGAADLLEHCLQSEYAQEFKIEKGGCISAANSTPKFSNPI